MRSLAAALIVVCAFALGGAHGLAGSAPQSRVTSTFPLTVDSIMRGPKLVGYPPSDLRWSGDSKGALLRMADAWRARAGDVGRRPRWRCATPPLGRAATERAARRGHLGPPPPAGVGRSGRRRRAERS